MTDTYFMSKLCYNRISAFSSASHPNLRSKSENMSPNYV